jgi:hypothetical protein
MPKIGAAVKVRKNAQYDTSTYKREKQPMRTLANRRARHQAKRELVRATRRPEKGRQDSKMSICRA